MLQDRELRVGQNVVDMNHSALKSVTPGGTPPARAERISLKEFSILRCGAVGDRHAVYLALRSHDETPFSTAEPRGIFDKRLEHRLKIKSRAADHLEDFAGGGLLLQGFGQVSVAGLELVEEADVFDGDHGLVGEGLEERDL